MPLSVVSSKFKPSLYTVTHRGPCGATAAVTTPGPATNIPKTLARIQDRLATLRSCERPGPRQASRSPLTTEKMAPDLRIFGALGGTRTPNLLIRSQMLYPLSYERPFLVV